MNHKYNSYKILYHFRYSYFAAKYRQKFRDWLWIKIRERKIKIEWSAENLQRKIDHEMNINNKNFEEALDIILID